MGFDRKAMVTATGTATESGVDRKAEMEKEEQTEEDMERRRFMDVYGLDMDYVLSKSRLHPIPGNGSKSVCVIGIDGSLPDDDDDDDDDGGGDEEKEVSKRARRIEQQSDHPVAKGIWVRFFLAQGSGGGTDDTNLGVEKEEDAAATATATACEGEHEYCDQNGFWSILAPFQEKRLDLDYFGFVSVGPNVYCLGGYSESDISSQVHVLAVDNDNNHLNYSWTLGPCMIRPRVSPVTLAVQGKIYAFGGVDPHDEAWAEVLDTTTTTPPPAWKALASPPMARICCGLFALVVDDGDNVFFGTEKEKEKEKEKDDGGGDKTILLGSTSDPVFFTYNIRESMWRPIPWDIPLEYFASDPVAVGHTLFWVGAYFCAYDLRLRLLYWGVVRGLDNHLQEVLWALWNQEDTFHTPTLHHLGGSDFCLTWFDWLGAQPHTFTRLHTTLIRVRIYEDSSSSTVPGGLDAFVVSSHSYLLPRGFRFSCSLLLDGFLCGQETTQKEGFVYEDMICLYKPSSEIKELEEGFAYVDVGKDSEML